MTEQVTDGLKTVVITGSTRGIGYGLADAFLSRECCVIISGREPARVTNAIDSLAERHSRERILSQTCDVREIEQVQALWDNACERFGQVDIWINNAGRSHPMSPVAQFDTEVALKVVETNLMGVIHGSRVALAGMRDQGFGALYNMEGLGSDGRQVPGLAIYGSTKRAVAYLTKALARECRGTSLVVGALRPGMVVTDLLTANLDRQSTEWEHTRRIFNILADRVERVAPWLADKILANRKSGVTISRLSGLKVMWRFLTAPIIKRRVLDD